MHRSYPLLFTYRDLIAGNGFVAGVACQGRVLLIEEDDGFWMSGVVPGSIAAGGEERSAAFRAFKERYLAVLFDIATEARSFAAFKDEVERFFAATNDAGCGEWEAAREKVRADALTLDLPKVTAKAPTLEVELIEIATPTVNLFDEIFEAAA